MAAPLPSRKRAFISTKRRLALLKAKKHVCHICKQPIAPTDPWDVSHVIPLELGGADDESNWDTAHRKCHREHTAKVDAPNIAEAKRREAKHVGAKAPARRQIRSKGFPPPKTKPPKLPMPARRGMYQ
jgi:5-methylcytosine-specific restriction endonuclease McrA